MYYMGNWVANKFEENDSLVKGKVIYKNFPLQIFQNDFSGFLGGCIDTFMISQNTNYKNQSLNS